MSDQFAKMPDREPRWANQYAELVAGVAVVVVKWRSLNSPVTDDICLGLQRQLVDISL